MTTATENLEELITILPGYDPYLQAGDCTFDEDAAQLVIEFIETMCTHVEGELGEQPFLLEDWQKAFFGNLFGWKHPNGLRRYREALLYIPRGNGKTALAACLVIVMLYLDEEKGAKLISAASESDQARLCFDVVQKMIQQHPSLEPHAELLKYSTVVGSKSYKAITSEAGSQHGKNIHLAVIDELHTHKDSRLVEALETGAGKRREPLIVHLTTADYDRESICNQKYDYACKVRDGIIEDQAFLPAIYEATITDDWTDPEVWQTANPNLGVSVPVEYMERKCKQAQDAPTYENIFKRFHLNIRTTTDVCWIPMEHWDECGKIPIDLGGLDGCECWGGLDLSSTKDITAFVLVFRRDEKYQVLCWFWIPEKNAEIRERRDHVPYMTWKRQGFIDTTPSESVEYPFIRKKINELGEVYKIREICVDPWNATSIVTDLTGDGFDVKMHRQGFASMNAPSKELERLILGHNLQHGGHPVLRWMASTVTVLFDVSANIRPVKKKGPERIDGIVALIMALSSASTSEDTTSVYEERGILML